MRIIGGLRLSFWLCASGALFLYAFFVGLSGIPPARLAGPTAVAFVLTALLMVRSIRVTSELADPGGDPRLRRELNRQRERRGF